MIGIEGLTVKYDELVAVRSVDLHVPAGTVFGLVGPNGAGKSSMMRAIAGLLVPAEGHCTVAGVDVQEDPVAVRRMIGYMPDFFGVYDHLLVWEYLEFFGELYDMSGTSLRRRIEEVLEITELEVKTDAEIGGLSRGMKQRLCLARAMVHEPEVLLLDEPASGVDPRGRYDIRCLIDRLGEMGTTVLVSSHILPELSDICDMIGIMEKGNLVAHGSVHDIAAELGAYRILTMQILDGKADTVPGVLVGFEHLHDIEVAGDTVRATLTDDPEALAELLQRLVNAGVRIGGIQEQRTELEELFLQLTRGELA